MKKTAQGQRNTELVEFHLLFNERGVVDEPAIAIVGATFLDNLIADILFNYMIADDKEVEEILRDGRSMGTFSSRITTAYCLGLICKTVRDDLRLISKIRNKFAHKLKISFDLEPIRDLCLSLKWHEFSLMTKTPTGATPRDIFEVGVNQLICYLSGRAELAQAERCKVRKEDEEGPTLLR